MGYYTDYQLTIEPYNKVSLSSEEINVLTEEISLLNVFEDGNVKDGYIGNAKWYDHDEDMRLLSSRARDILFYLHGEGENPVDLWDTYYLNGRSQFCPADIVYPPFDEHNLGEPIEVSDKNYSYQNRTVTRPSPPSSVEVSVTDLL